MFTKEMLPVVTTERVMGLLEEYRTVEDHPSFVDNIYSSMLEENPAIFEYFASSSKKSASFHKESEFNGGLLVYWMLKSMGESLLLKGEQPDLPEGCYTREGLPIVNPKRFEEWNTAPNDISDDEEETVETLAAEMWQENQVLEESVELFAKNAPSDSQYDVIRNAAVIYLAMRRQSALYLSGEEGRMEVE